MLKEEITKILDSDRCADKNTYAKYIERLEQGDFTRDENPQTHFCAYFLPFNPQNKKVFIVHHKKSGLWISPGGHIDKGEGLLQTLNRELHEELGLVNHFQEDQQPFLFSITPIENKVQPCKAHYDIWYLVSTDGSQFNIDPTEFLETKWMTVEEARSIVTDPANMKALEAVENL